MSISPDKNRISDPNPVLDLGKLKKKSLSSCQTTCPTNGSTPTRHCASCSSKCASNLFPTPAPPPPTRTLIASLCYPTNCCSRSSVKSPTGTSIFPIHWCVVSGKLIRSIELLDWEFLESGRLTFRFPDLVDVSLAHACIISERNSGILFINRLLSIHLSSGLFENDRVLISHGDVLDSEEVDRGVRIMVQGCRNLRRVVLMNVGEKGLSFLGEECECSQEMELHYSGDLALPGIFKCQNLQILELIGSISGVYDSVVTDIGLTILAQGCRRLVKLELVGCEGSYDGIKAIGQCCQMLEEFTLCNHKMDGGWLSALSYCENLKTLKILSCNEIDRNPGSDEHLWPCPMLEELHLRQCQMREKQGVRALFLVCRSIRS